jgi:hypothetical protein
MYVNGKMRPAETVPGMGEGGMKEPGGGVNSSMIYLIYCKNFSKCHSVPPPSTTIKKRGYLPDNSGNGGLGSQTINPPTDDHLKSR